PARTFGVSPKQFSQQRPRLRDAIANTRDACATRSSARYPGRELNICSITCETLRAPFAGAKFRRAQIDPAPVFRARRNPFLAAPQNSARSPLRSAKEVACR